MNEKKLKQGSEKLIPELTDYDPEMTKRLEQFLAEITGYDPELKKLVLNTLSDDTATQKKAEEKLVKLACKSSKGTELRTLVSEIIFPGTYKDTFRLVQVMKDIGLPAKEVCVDFFAFLKTQAIEKMVRALSILEGSELYPFVKPIVVQRLKKSHRTIRQKKKFSQANWLQKVDELLSTEGE